MPTKISSVGNGMFQVRTPNMIHAKATTKEKAEGQARLLNAIEHNPDFKPYKRSKVKKYED